MTYRHTTHLHGDFLDGDLPQEQIELVERHVAECSECRDDLEKLKNLTRTLRQIDPPDPGDEYFDRLNDTLMARTASMIAEETLSVSASGSRNTGRKVLKTLIKLVAAVTLLFTAFYISDFNQEKRATRWAEHIDQSGFVASDGTDPEDQLIQTPVGINMLLGIPSVVDVEEEPKPEETNLE